MTDSAEVLVTKQLYWTAGDVGRFFGSDSQAARRWSEADTDFPKGFRNPLGYWRWEPGEVVAWAREHGWPIPEEFEHLG